MMLFHASCMQVSDCLMLVGQSKANLAGIVVYPQVASFSLSSHFAPTLDASYYLIFLTSREPIPTSLPR
jgi:hypothetical protein